MRVCGLVSGGKDSCCALMQCVAAGHDIVALANLKPPSSKDTELDSYMYQTAGHEAIETFFKAFDNESIKCYRGQIDGNAFDTSNIYEGNNEKDEVEDLYRLLRKVKDEVGIEAVSTGAILSDYQRVRVENVCSRLGLISLAYLWRRQQSSLLQEMIEANIEAVIVKVAALGLDQSHLGLSLAQLRPRLELKSKEFGLHVCGEGGEFETFVLDCPLFKKRIEIVESEVIIHSDDAFAPVAILKLKKLRLVDKQISSMSQQSLISCQGTPLDHVKECIGESSPVDCHVVPVDIDDTSHQIDFDSKFVQVEEVRPIAKDPIQALDEGVAILRERLRTKGMSLANVVRVKLELRDLKTDYVAINKAYSHHFGNTNPPCRSCIENRQLEEPLIMSLVAYRAVEERDARPAAMHVQSISHWAPANIGPYSQAIRVGNRLFLSGQIGLVPGSMKLLENEIDQTRLSLRHVSRLLEAHDFNLGHVIDVKCFVIRQNLDTCVRDVWRKAFEGNPKGAPVQPQVTLVSGLPRGAGVEWEVVAEYTAACV